MITRGLLLAGYLFLFAGQFNYRYFTIANFYVYSHNANDARSLVTADGANHVIRTASASRSTAHWQHTVNLFDNTQRPAHLGIDKRYNVQQGIRVPQIRAPGSSTLTLSTSSSFSLPGTITPPSFRLMPYEDLPLPDPSEFGS